LDSKQKRLEHKDKWPTGKVEEYHLYQCPKCKGWKRLKAGPVKKVIYCSTCGCFMEPRGLVQMEV